MRLKGWLPPIVWAGAILTATSLPSSAVPRQVSEFDKVIHFTIYALLAILLTRSLTEVTTRWRAVLLALVISTAFGAIDAYRRAVVLATGGSELAAAEAGLSAAHLSAATAAAVAVLVAIAAFPSVRPRRLLATKSNFSGIRSRTPASS